MTRRTFLNRTAILSAAATLPSFSLRAADKSGTKIPVIGEGAHTYECVHDWLVPPQGLVWGDTHGLCQDAAGLIYVAHTVNRASMRGEAVVVFDANGRFVRAFGEEFRGGAHGLSLRREANEEILYHCDINRCRIVKTDLLGRERWHQSYPKEDPAYGAAPVGFCPTNVAFAPNGDFFVADGYGSNRVLRFSKDGKFLSEVGAPGPLVTVQTMNDEPPDSPAVAFREPHGLHVDHRQAEPVLLIGDRRNRRLQTFALNDGRLLKTVKDADRLRLPCHFDSQGDWIVCADLESQVCILDRDYRVVAQLGDSSDPKRSSGQRRSTPRGDFPIGKFIAPHSAIFLKSGDILVAEWLPTGRITLLRKVS